MIDAHIAFTGPYTYERLLEYIDKAMEQGLQGIVILEPTHKFKECKVMYREVCTTYPCQREWFQSVNTNSIKDYQRFILEMRQKEFPIQVQFGLEVCYFTQHETFIRKLKSEFDYDVFIGCIHFLDNLAFAWIDHSHEMLWDKYNAGFLYRRYYEMMNAMLTSQLFDGIAGFDTIKALKVPCKFKLDHTYHKLAMLLAKQKLYVEDDASLGYLYQHEDAGLSKPFLTICKEQGVIVKRVSNAQCLDDVGRF
ncbi:histidinol-phosphatase [[Eubacterium] hominis]|uniref:histidinol-phosphatase n=1 Tax=[Eubacterium] hominis TaxID=2764325 RepID=UPI003A4DBCD7